MNKTTFIAVGDIFITRRIPAGGYKGFGEVRDCICAHDVRFSNLEMTFHDQEGYPTAFSGGTWAMTSPRMLDDIKLYGFNIYNTANNHSCDYSHGGVLATIRHLKERDMIFAGTGKNLADATRACYLETDKGRIALIGVSASFHESAMGGTERRSVRQTGTEPFAFSYGLSCHTGELPEGSGTGENYEDQCQNGERCQKRIRESAGRRDYAVRFPFVCER